MYHHTSVGKAGEVPQVGNPSEEWGYLPGVQNNILTPERIIADMSTSFIPFAVLQNVMGKKVIAIHCSSTPGLEGIKTPF